VSLPTGSRLGPYEILGPLGAGGMGEVYRARDTNLSRDVAIKVLPENFAADPDRLARFQREARTLATLNHTNIAQIFGLETSDQVRALAMELVEGEELSVRLARGALPLDEALPIARQIAQALEAAHDRGIIHRDLKPANIKVRPDGTVKVLDFGLAKALDAEDGSAALSNSPTLLASMPGIILGTAAYMSPEQARGKVVDEQTDIWAFGCVLFEMVTGKRAFAGDTVSDVVAGILKTEPDWSSLPATMPAAIRRLLARCLAKDPRERLHAIADARLEIDEAQRGPSAVVDRVVAPRNRERLAWAAALTAALLAAVVLGFRVATRPVPTASEVRLEITTPATTDPSVALSPDGEQIAFLATGSGRPRLWVRSLNSTAARALPGTDGAAFPFWEPQGRSLGFFSDDGKLKRVDINGGAVRVLANANLQWGATWGRDDTILFGPATGPILRIPAAGGQPPAAVTRLEPHQSNHSYPHFLPDGEHFVYYVSGSPEVRGVYIARLGKPEGQRLVDADSIGACIAAGHLLFVRGTTVFAQPLDFHRLQLTGMPAPVAESIAMRAAAGSQVAALSASASGRIAYRTGTAALERQFIWFDRSGRDVAKVGEPIGGNPLSPSLSTDQRWLAFHRATGGNVDLWRFDIARGVLSRLTSNPGNDIHPTWSPDSSRILFSSNRNGSYEAFEKSIASGEEKAFLPLQSPLTDWSRDGRFVLVQRRPKETTDIFALEMGASRDAVPVVQTDFEERNGQFSPDGRWIAYESTESGRWEIYVQPFPGPGARVQVSVNGGAQVRWRPDGKELFFIALDDRLMAVPIQLPSGAGSAEPGAPIALFGTRVGGAVQAPSRQQYFVSSDGQRFLMNTILQAAPISPITVIVNWTPRAPTTGQ
jgi:eukaryotic-like serine/threonine-protein kinase